MIIRTLASHYRRHPLQGLFLLAGIIMANVLLVGTQLINAQARSSYAEGEVVLGSGPIARIYPADGSAFIDETDYIKLRRAGFDTIAPLLRHDVISADGVRLQLLGVDALAMPQSSRGSSTRGTASGFSGFAFAPYELWAAAPRIRQLGLSNGQQLLLDNGTLLPPVQTAPGEELGHRVLIDLGALQQIADRSGKLSELLVLASSQGRIDALLQALPAQLRFESASEAPDPGQLTRSFHLNLAAMGLLAFVVGLFLIYNALAFSYTDRRELLRKLRLSGVPRAELGRALILELLLFLLVGSFIGLLLGSQLAALLLPGVGQTLAQLYGVYISYPDSLIGTGFWMPLAMTLIAGAACALFPLRKALDTPLLARWSAGWGLRQAAIRDRLLLSLGLVFLMGAALLAQDPQSTWVALIGMACLLLGAALLLPAVLRSLLAVLSWLVPKRAAGMNWLLADSRWLLGPASLALMAMTLALVANSGLNTMIGSFRQATDDWLSQRLAADLYLRGSQDEQRIARWLSENEPRAGLTLRHQIDLERAPPEGAATFIQVADLASEPRFLNSVDLIKAVPDAETRFKNGQGVYISERAWRLDGWQLGQAVDLCDGRQGWPVLGIYHDYGNPMSQWMVIDDLFRECWPNQSKTGIGIFGPPEVDFSSIRSDLVRLLDLQSDDIINQEELRALGIGVFDRTFTVTRALNVLTLVVAGIGIFCAISAIHHHRTGQQALLASLGLARRERLTLLLLQWGMLGLLCMSLVWPFGTLLAAYLAGVVTPAAFGWSFALQADWSHYGVLAITAAACLVAAVLLPSLRLLGTSPASLLKEQTL